MNHGVVAQHWSASTITLSYLISVTGSFCTIQLMEQWRQYEAPRTKTFLLVLSALTLGGCGIWCTHFTGMNAMDLRLDDGTLLEMYFEVGFTILSLVFPVFGVFVGLRIASTDPFFLEIEQNRRKELLVEALAKTKMEHVVKKDEVARRIKYTALFSRLWRILGGGLFAALGVLGMHYLGMSAQRTNAEMELDGGVVALSCVIAFATANAAFWILFRAHTFWPHNEALRIASALVMGVAVCGTHYTGMASATYLHTEENFAHSTRFVINGPKTGMVASHASILLCYWLTSVGVTRSVKTTETMLRSRANERTSVPPSRVVAASPVERFNGRAKVYAGKDERQSRGDESKTEHTSRWATPYEQEELMA